MTRKLVWEKYVDPRGDNLHQVEWPGAFNEDLPSDSDVLDDEENDDEPRGVFRRVSQQVLLTPHGIVPLTEHNLPSTKFNFWTGHSNFELGEAEWRLIEGVSGVEILEPFSRYRFRISIGTLFDSTTVKVNIQEALSVDASNNVERLSLLAMYEDVKKLVQQYKYWAILELPNGEVMVEYANEKTSEYEQKVGDMLALQELVGARFETHDEKQSG